jgi:hypothetical protein
VVSMTVPLSVHTMLLRGPDVNKKLFEKTTVYLSNKRLLRHLLHCLKEPRSRLVR